MLTIIFILQKQKRRAYRNNAAQYDFEKSENKKYSTHTSMLLEKVYRYFDVLAHRWHPI